MILVNTLGKSHYSKLGIYHTVLIKGEQVLSYEMNSPLGKGRFRLYSKTDWQKDITILNSKEVPDIDIHKYKDLKLNGYTCFEAIEYIYYLEGVKMNTGRLKTYLIIGTIGFVIMLVTFIIGVITGVKLDDSITSFIDILGEQ